MSSYLLGLQIYCMLAKQPIRVTTKTKTCLDLMFSTHKGSVSEKKTSVSIQFLFVSFEMPQKISNK